MRPQQLFGWRREMREGGLSPAGEEAAVFVPLVARPPGEAGPSKSTTETDACVALRGVVVRVRGRIAAAVLAEVLAAVKIVT